MSSGKVSWCSSRRVCEVEEVKRRLELALKPAESPTVEEVLRHVERHGVLRGPVDWVFDAWRLYVEYAKERIAERFNSTQDEAAQLEDFTHKLNALLGLAREQAREKLESVQKAVREGTYTMKGRRLYAPDGTWIYVGTVVMMPIHGISARTVFPDVLKMPREKLELLQLGWRASDEGVSNTRPFMGTTQPWQVFAWAATRPGKMQMLIADCSLTTTGVSVLIRLTALSWREQWNKEEAIELTLRHIKSGELTPLLTLWLGDGKVKRHKRYKLIISVRDPWKLGQPVDKYDALISDGAEIFVKLKEAAGEYGSLLEELHSHKWTFLKLEPRTRRKKQAYTRSKISATIFINGIKMYLGLVAGRGGSIYAACYTSYAEALEILEKLKKLNLKPNMICSGSTCMVYIATTDLLKIAQEDLEVRKTIAWYLQEKAKNGTPKQREAAVKILKRHPIFYPPLLASPSALLA